MFYGSILWAFNFLNCLSSTFWAKIPGKLGRQRECLPLAEGGWEGAEGAAQNALRPAPGAQGALCKGRLSLSGPRAARAPGPCTQIG